MRVAGWYVFHAQCDFKPDTFKCLVFLALLNAAGFTPICNGFKSDAGDSLPRLNQGRTYIKENTFMNYRSERDAFEAGKISSGPNPYLTNSVEHRYFEDGSSLPLPAASSCLLRRR